MTELEEAKHNIEKALGLTEKQFNPELRKCLESVWFYLDEVEENEDG